MFYLALMTVHISLALVSVGGFIFRWMLMMRGSAWVQHRITRTLPHLIDTLFLATGITLAVVLDLNPLAHPWLAAKLAGLVVYIVAASLAFRHARSNSSRSVFLVIALLAFAWIISVAILKTPAGFLSLATF